MKPLAFSKSGKFWRGNLHTHSNRSDGLLSPDDLCQRYKDEGYNFLVISDHFVGLYNYPITEPLDFNDPEFITIFGAELHSVVPFLIDGFVFAILGSSARMNPIDDFMLSPR